MGYCNAGVVIEVGARVTGFSVGDRIASNGRHAEMVCVPKNLCARIPDGVSDESAAFTVIGAIALQGIRLAQPTLGETFVVLGLGSIGLVTVQLLRARGAASWVPILIRRGLHAHENSARARSIFPAGRTPLPQRRRFPAGAASMR